MLLIKIIAIAFVALVGYNVLKSVKPEFSVALIVAVGAVILILLSDSVVTSLSAFATLTEKSGISVTSFASVVKIIGIGYLTEYAASICEDGGSKSLGQKVQFAGKITVFLIALPIIMNVFTVIESVL